MDKDLLNRLLIIAWALLAIAGIVFLCISIFGDDKTNTSLPLALGCIALSNLFNVIRLMINKKK